MLVLPMILWILLELSAPTWCFVCWTICAICTFIKFCIDLIELGEKLTR